MNRSQTDHDALKHLENSLCRRWRRYHQSSQRCKEKFSNTRVHNARVATRRLISTLELLRPFASRGKIRKCVRTLKDYLNNFGDLRDAQVHLARVEEMVDRFSAAKQFHKWLESREAAFTRRARKAIKEFKIKGLTRRIEALENELREMCKESRARYAFKKINRALNEAFARVMVFRNCIKADQPRTIHRVRVAFKYFRYMAEELSPLLPDFTPGRRKAMQNYQSKMGDIQDAITLIAAFDEFHAETEILTHDTEAFRACLKLREKRSIEKYLKSADDLRKFKP